jgi:hypothetical protein
VNCEEAVIVEWSSSIDDSWLVVVAAAVAVAALQALQGADACLEYVGGMTRWLQHLFDLRCGQPELAIGRGKPCSDILPPHFTPGRAHTRRVSFAIPPLCLQS